MLSVVAGEGTNTWMWTPAPGIGDLRFVGVGKKLAEHAAQLCAVSLSGHRERTSEVAAAL